MAHTKQKICSEQHLNKIHVNNVKPSVAHKLHTSANYRSNINAYNQTLDFWDVALVSLAVVGVSIGFINSSPFERYNILSLEESDIDDCKADIEMTLHQPPSFDGHVKTISPIASTDAQAVFLNKNVSNKKPYDVSCINNYF